MYAHGSIYFDVCAFLLADLLSPEGATPRRSISSSRATMSTPAHPITRSDARAQPRARQRARVGTDRPLPPEAETFLPRTETRQLCPSIPYHSISSRIADSAHEQDSSSLFILYKENEWVIRPEVRRAVSRHTCHHIRCFRGCCRFCSLFVDIHK